MTLRLATINYYLKLVDLVLVVSYPVGEVDSVYEETPIEFWIELYHKYLKRTNGQGEL